MASNLKNLFYADNNWLVEVIGDVSGGDRVVTRGAERLKPGQEVVVAGG